MGNSNSNSGNSVIKSPWNNNWKTQDRTIIALKMVSSTTNQPFDALNGAEAELKARNRPRSENTKAFL